ncbi:hypothetical protein HDU80_000011 [Chytriomyces hyalinus]|nr:hypothetical protein HDU80_000011 [Chytriomyces hyalinus]
MTRSLPFRLVNVFCGSPSSEGETEKPNKLQGNALCVFEDGTGLSDSEMQALALQFNLSETTFLLPQTRKDADKRVRIFTPGTELPFAGHPTLGSAFVVNTMHGSCRGLEMGAGLIPVEHASAASGSTAEHGQVWTLSANAAAFRVEYNVSAIAAMVGLSESDIVIGEAHSGGCTFVNAGIEQLMVQVKSVEILMRASCTSIAAMRALACEGVLLYVKESLDMKQTVTSRFFFCDTAAVFEDPGTGSACANLGRLLQRDGERGEFELEQGHVLKRLCKIRISVGDEFVRSLRWDALLVHSLANQDALLGHKTPSNFAAASSYAAWKASLSLPSVNSGRSPSKGPEAPKPVLVYLTVSKASALKQKDANGLANPYVVITDHSHSVLAVSECVIHTLSPTWDLSIAIPLAHLNEPIHISIWNKPSIPKKSALSSMRNLLKGRQPSQQNESNEAPTPPHPFLGLVSLPSAYILSRIENKPILEEWFPLQKRNPKSHVSGRVLISWRRIELYPTDVTKTSAALFGRELYAKVFRCIPPEPILAFQEAYRTCLEADFQEIAASFRVSKDDNLLLSTASIELLKILSKHWFIDDCARGIIELEEHTRLYRNDKIPAKVFFGIFPVLVGKLDDAYQRNIMSIDELATFQEIGVALHKRVLDGLSTFFDAPLEEFTSSSSKQFEFLVNALDTLQNHVLLAQKLPPTSSDGSGSMLSHLAMVDALLNESLSIRCRLMARPTQSDAKLVAGASELTQEGHELVRMAVNIVDELQVLNELFDDLILRKFHIPTMAARIYTDIFLSAIEAYLCNVMRSDVPLSLDIGFSVYGKVQELLPICGAIDYRLLDQFAGVLEWFQPFLEQFIACSEEKIGEWVQNAVAVDDFSIQASGHSSSVLDIFMSFQQQIDFVLKLEWPLDNETALFIGKLIENIGEGVEKYTLLMRQGISSELQPKQSLPLPTRSINMLLPTSQSTASNLSKLSSGNSNTTAVNSAANVQVPVIGSNNPPARKKFKLKIRKSGPPIDGSEMRISQISCVKLANITYLVGRFDSLIDSIPAKFRSMNVRRREKSNSSSTHSKKPLPAIPGTEELTPTVEKKRRISPSLYTSSHATRNNSTLMNSRTSGTLTFLSAKNLNIVRPYATLVSFRISTIPTQRTRPLGDAVATEPESEREIGRTNQFHQAQTIKRNQTAAKDIEPCVMPFLLTDAEISRGLQITVVHHVPISAFTSTATKMSAGHAYHEYTVAVEGFSLEGVVNAAILKGPAEGCVFGVAVAGGMVMLQMVIDEEVVATAVRNRLAYVVHWAIEDSKRVLVDKMCFDLRIRLKDVSAEHKKIVILANNFVSLFSSKAAKQKNTRIPASTSDKPSEEGVHAKLTPLLDFIDGNLFVIAETMSLELANCVVLGIWERFIDIAESLIVPHLSEEQLLDHRKKAWEESRVVFLSHVVGIVKSFLHADGEGISIDELDSFESLTSLDLLFTHYRMSKKELLQMHAGTTLAEESWKDEWLLRLIKLRGGSSDYINDAIKRKI